MKKLIPFLALALAACAPGYANPGPPAKVTMLKPPAFPSAKTGEDANEQLIKAAEVYSKLRFRHLKLQEYVRTARSGGPT